MTPEQFESLISKLDILIYLVQVSFVALCFLCGFISAQFVVHAKNQKHLF